MQMLPVREHQTASAGSHQQINHMAELEAASALQTRLHSELCSGTRTCHWKNVFCGLIEIDPVIAV